MSGTANEPVLALLKGTFDASKLRFETSLGDEVTYTNVNDSTYKLTLPKKPFTYDVYAFEDELKMGKLRVHVFEVLTKKVRVVPLTALTIDQAALEASIEQTFKGANIDIELSVEALYSSANFDHTTVFDDPETDLLARYTSQMRALRTEYTDQNTLEKGEYLLFVVPQFQTTDIDGYMVRGRGLGFVVENTNSVEFYHTIAHELAHGMGGLEHTWENNGPDQGTTNNLMDYNNGSKLIANQWKKLRNPGIVFSLLDGEEDGSFIGKFLVPKDWRGADGALCFLTPGKSVAKFDYDKFINPVFTLGFGTTIDTLLASGLLYRFDYETVDEYIHYEAVIENDVFKGYKGDDDTFLSTYLSPHDQDKIIVPLPSHSGIRYNAISNNSTPLLPYMNTGQVNQTLFMLDDYANSTLQPADKFFWSSEGISKLSKIFFDPGTTNFLTLEGFELMQYLEQIPGGYNEAYNRNYQNLVKIMMLRNAYPNVYAQMSGDAFGNWEGDSDLNDRHYEYNDLPQYYFPTGDFSNGIPIDINYFIDHDYNGFGYFNYLYYRNDYYSLPKSQQTHKFLIHFIEFIRANNKNASADVATIKAACQAEDLSSLSSLSVENIRHAVEAMSVNELADLCISVKTELIAVLLNDPSFIVEQYERSVDKLMWTTPREKETDLLVAVCSTYKNDEVIIKTLIDKVDDFGGEDFNTKIMNWMIRAYNRSDILTLSKSNLNSFVNRVLTYNYPGWEERLYKSLAALDRYLGDSPSTVNAKTDVSISSDPDNTTVNYLNTFVTGFFPSDAADDDTIKLKLLDPVVLTADGKVFDLYADNKGFAVPAVILYFIEKKADSESAKEAVETSILLALDVLELSSGIGEAHAVLKLLAYADKLGTAAGILSNATKHTSEGLSNALDMTSTILGLGSFGGEQIAKKALLDKKLLELSEIGAATGRNKTVKALNAMSNDINDFKSGKHIQGVESVTRKINAPSTPDEISRLQSIQNDADAKAFMINVLEGERKAAKNADKPLIEEQIRRAIAKIRNAKPEWYQNALYSATSQYSGIWNSTGQMYSKSNGGTLLAHFEDGKGLVMDNVHNKISDLNLSEEARMIDGFDDAAYRSSSATIKEDVIVFNDNGTIKCLTGIHCFTEGTLVKTKQGQKAIEDIKKGDEVFAFNEENKVSGFKKVRAAFHKTTKSLQRLIIGKDTIFATPGHPFYTAKGWVKAATLSVGMSVLSSHGAIPVQENLSIDTTATVYNFDVAEYHTYHVGQEELIVHNDCKKAADIAKPLGTKSNEFLADFPDANYIVTHFDGKPELIEAWRKISDQPYWVRKNINLLTSLSGKSDDFIARVNTFYNNLALPKNLRRPLPSSIAMTFNGNTIIVQYNKYGLPIFGPHMTPITDNGINLAKTYKGPWNEIGSSSHNAARTNDLKDATNWALETDAAGNLVNFPNGRVRRYITAGGNPSPTRIEILDDNGNWIPQTWHHHENGRDLIPVPSDIHNHLNHSGGFAAKHGPDGTEISPDTDITEIFDYAPQMN